MRVLYVSFDVVPAPKGASTHILAFVRALSQRHEVTLLTLPSAELGPVTLPGVRHLSVDVAEPNFLRRAVAFSDAVEAHLEENRYDVVHFRSVWEGVPAATGRRYGGHAVCYELNGLPSIELKYHYPGLARRQPLIRTLQQDEKLCMDLADAIVTPSPVTAQYIAEQDVDPAKVHVIPNGVDTELFRPGGDGGPRDLLYVGTLAPWQGLELLFKALRKLLGRTGGAEDADEEHEIAPTDVKLTVCGGGRKAWRREIERLARKMRIDDRVAFTGSIPQAEVAELIRRAGICVAPLAPDDRNLRQGCCPIKLLEYAACRKPIVCADLQVATDLLTPEGEMAAYRSRSAHNLAERIAELIARPALAAELAERAWEKVTGQFTWEIAGERLLEVYEGLRRG